jgi:zinc protease
VDPAQLATVKSHLKYRFARAMASAATTGATLASFVRYERDIETLNRYYRSFDRVEPKDVVAVANSVFADTNRTVVSVSNQDKLEGADGFRAIDAEVAKTGTRPAPAAPAAKAEPPKKKTAAEQFAERDSVTNDLSAAKWAAEQARVSVYLVEQRSNSPLIDVSMLIKAGATYDPPGKKGLAQLTASMLSDGGSESMSYEQIQKALFPLAAGLESQVDKDMVRLHALVHRDNLAAFWAVASEQIVKPAFTEADFKRLKQQQLNDLKVGLRSNNDEEFAKEALYERIYGPEHPYGSVTLGHVKDLESITLGDVKAFYKKWYLRNRVHIGLAGGYDDAFLERVMSTLGLLAVERTGTQEVPAPVAAVQAKRRALVIEKESPSVAVSFGVPLDLKRGDKDWPALWLARAWLGEHRSSKARLFQRIREERGMNYGDYAYIEYFPRGMFAMQPEPNYTRRNDIFQVWIRPLRNNNDALFATRVAMYEVQRIVDKGMTAAEFESTREYLKKYVAVLTAHQSKALGYALDSVLYKTPPFVEYVRESLDQLSLEDVNAAIKKHFKLDGAEFVFVGKDAKGLADMLAKDAPSPITYNAPKPDELMAEDKVIAKLPFKLAKDRIKVTPASEMFE